MLKGVKIPIINKVILIIPIIKQIGYLCLAFFSFMLIFIAPIFSHNPTTEKDSLHTYINIQLKEAEKVRNQDLNKAVSITERLLQNPLVLKDDSIFNHIRYKHSLYLLLLDKNSQSKEMILKLLPYYKDRATKRWTILNIRLGSIELKMGNYEEAIRYLEEMLPYTQKLKMPINEGLIYIYLSDIYRFKSDFGNAYKKAELALESFTKLNRPDWISVAWTTLAYICVLAKDYDGASAYFDLIFEGADKMDDNLFIAKPTLYSGILNFERGNIPLARKQFEKGLEKINLMGTFHDLPIVYQYFGKICIIEKEYPKAKIFIQKGIESAEKSFNKRQKYSGDLLLFQLELITHPNKENLKSVKEIYTWALENEDNILLKESSNYLSNYYQKKGDYKAAYIYKEVYVNASEKKIEKEKLNEISLLKEKGKYEQEARERELNEKKLELELEWNQKIKNFMILGICLLLIKSGLLLYYYAQKRKAYSSLHKSNQELTKTEKDLEFKNAELKKYIESNIQLEQFAHVASHDLRAPLITINSFAKLLDNTVSHKLNETEKAFIQYIRSNGEQMFDLVNDLLEYSKINSQKIHTSQINIQTLVEGVISTLQNQADEKKVLIKITKRLPEITADEIKIKRVFQNLISNAIKFSDPSKDSKVDVYIKETPKRWMFIVQDNGIGMKENDKDIFQPYIQLNRKADYKGTGLGLSFCQKIIQQHGGEINFESVWGKGSSFYFTLPKTIRKTRGVNDYK